MTDFLARRSSKIIEQKQGLEVAMASTIRFQSLVFLIVILIFSKQGECATTIPMQRHKTDAKAYIANLVRRGIYPDLASRREALKRDLKIYNVFGGSGL